MKIHTPQHPRALRLPTRQPFRPTPQLPASDMRTFSIAAPLRTHWREATCEQVRCPHFLNGWRVRVENLPLELLRTAKTSGRKFTELRVAEGETWLVFEAGQTCFRGKHVARDEYIPELLVIRDGDWRGNPRGTAPKKCSADEWINRFGDNQAWLAARIER